MELIPITLKKIIETSYLTADNYFRYRAILRYFYYEYEKIRYWLYKEDIYNELRHYEEFSDYTMDQCKSDLDALVNWKNIVPMQDSSTVYTIEEYKNKQYRYYLSEYTVEIERLTIKLENLLVEGASLSPSLFERIKNSLVKMNELQKESLADIHLWWDDLQSDFKRLNQNYQDYIRTFYSPNTDKFMKSMDFIIYKDNLIKYLREFVKELQRNTPYIESFLKSLPEERVVSILNSTIEYESSIVRLDKEVSKEQISDNIWGKWYSLKIWFLGEGDNKMSESLRIMDITNKIISKIVRNASLISQMRNLGLSKSDDYKKFLSLFRKCENINECHKLSSAVFGSMTIMHYRINRQRDTESITSSTFDEKPSTFEITPRKRGYRTRSEISGFVDKSQKKQEALEKYLEEVNLEKELILKFMKDDKIEISNLPKGISPKIRDKLLFWITMATNTTSLVRTEDGIEYFVTRDKRFKNCTLFCEDGDLNMPPYIINFRR